MQSGQQLILQNISRHISLDAIEENYFLSMLKPISINRKDFLLQAGEVCRYEYFITKGCLRCYHIDEEGTEHIILFAPEDWWIGDLYSLLTQTPARLHIDALENTEILAIAREDMEVLYERVPKFERFFRIIFQRAFIAQEQRIIQNLSSTAEERYEAFKLKYPGLVQRIAQKQIAAFLGITPVFLSMLRRKAISK